MKRIRYAILIICLISGFGLAAFPANVGAVDPLPACSSVGDSRICDAKGDNLAGFVKSLVNGLLYILGAVAVIVIILAGIFYTTSGGNAASVKRAKDTLLYAVVGLLVALFSYAIVNYVLTQFK